MTSKEIKHATEVVKRLLKGTGTRGAPRINDTEVHYWKCVSERTDRGLEPLWDAACRTGAYHIHITMNKDLVNCPRCKEKLGKEIK